MKHSPYISIDIEIFGQEFCGHLSDLEKNKARIVFWVEQSFITKFSPSFKLTGRKIHFHRNHHVYYMLIKHTEFETVAENPSQIKITLEGELS
jgi:hypothetical protein